MATRFPPSPEDIIGDIMNMEVANQTAAREEEPLQLHGSDHPGLILVSTPLTGNNYLSWSRSMHIALGAKNKLDLINGKAVSPKENSEKYEQWKKVDYMVTSWILNCLSKEIVDAFLYVNSAFELWQDIAECFGESNCPLLYQLQKEIATLRQGADSVVIYFTKLKRLWDEYSSLVSLPPCTCGVSKLLADIDVNTKLMQFLMGLNDSFDNIRSQLLLLDPLPTVNKAYSMILRVEKQRSIQVAFPDLDGNAAMNTRVFGTGRGGQPRSSNAGNNWGTGRGRGVYRRTKEEKAKLICEHCQMPGHEMRDCFKLHGIPDWYVKLKEQRVRAQAYMVDTPTGMENKGNTDSTVKKDVNLADISNLIQQEVAKLMTKHAAPSPGTQYADSGSSHAHFVEYAGPAD